VFKVVLLDGKNAIMKDVTISEGSLTLSIVHPREAFLPAIRESAAAVIFVHNHPSGDPEASPEDRALTQRLVSVGELVGIRVLDHVIVGDGRYVSFADQGWLSFSS
jgi:DNA repair protein RadC